MSPCNQEPYPYGPAPEKPKGIRYEPYVLPEAGGPQPRRPRRKGLWLKLAAAGLLLLLVAAVWIVPKERDYRAAAALLAAGEYEAAQALYTELGSYRQAPGRAGECANHLAYEAAAGLAAAAKWGEAEAAFAALGDFDDSNARAIACQRERQYEQACAALAAGQYYDAYCRFLALTDLRDSAQQAAACLREYPASGALYRAEGYRSDFAAFAFDTDRPQRGLYVRIYDKDKEELVASVFSRCDEAGRVSLPKGEYLLHFSLGVEWFGETDMFGLGGEYYEWTRPVKLRWPDAVYEFTFFIDPYEPVIRPISPQEF